MIAGAYWEMNEVNLHDSADEEPYVLDGAGPINGKYNAERSCNLPASSVHAQDVRHLIHTQACSMTYTMHVHVIS
jgi:hypothetical protein